MCSLINKQLLLTAYAYLYIMEQQKGQQGSEAVKMFHGLGCKLAWVQRQILGEPARTPEADTQAKAVHALGVVIAEVENIFKEHAVGTKEANKAIKELEGRNSGHLELIAFLEFIKSTQNRRVLRNEGQYDRALQTSGGPIDVKWYTTLPREVQERVDILVDLRAKFDKAWRITGKSEREKALTKLKEERSDQIELLEEWAAEQAFVIYIKTENGRQNLLTHLQEMRKQSPKAVKGYVPDSKRLQEDASFFKEWYNGNRIKESTKKTVDDFILREEFNAWKNDWAKMAETDSVGRKKHMEELTMMAERAKSILDRDDVLLKEIEFEKLLAALAELRNNKTELEEETQLRTQWHDEKSGPEQKKKILQQLEQLYDGLERCGAIDLERYNELQKKEIAAEERAAKGRGEYHQPGNENQLPNETVRELREKGLFLAVVDEGGPRERSRVVIRCQHPSCLNYVAGRFLEDDIGQGLDEEVPHLCPEHSTS